MQSKGPSAQYLSKLIIEDPNRAPERVFKTNQKYAEYIAYLGSQKQPITAYSKLAQWKQYQFENVNLLIDPAKISPLLSALTDENKLLKQECFKQSNDIVELTTMVERLIDDNIVIKKHLDLKTNEMQHFLQTQKTQSNEEIQDLKFQIQSLQDENNLLITHLEDLRRNQNDDVINNLETELSNARDLYEQQQQNFKQCQDREYDISRELVKINSQYKDSLEKIVELSSQLSIYEDNNHELRNQIMLISNKINIVQKNAFDQVNEKEIELESMQIKFNAIIKDKESIKNQLNQYELKISELIKDNTKLSEEMKMYQLMNNELLNQEKDIKNQLEIEKMKKPTNNFDEQIPKEQLIKECRRLGEQLERAQLEYIKLDDFLTKQIDLQKKQSEQILENMKIRYQTSLDSRQEQINQLEKQIAIQIEQINIQKKELEIINLEYQEIKQKQEDQSQLKKLVDQQVMEIRVLKSQLQDKKMLINEMLEEKDKMSKLFKSEQIAKQQNVHILEEEIKQLQNQQIKYQSQKEDLEKLLEINDNLKQEIHHIQQQYKDIQVLCREEIEKRQNLQVEAGIQANQIGTLKEQIRYFQDQQQRKDKLDQVLQENQILRAQLKQ
ncbi:unnamed protein product [Paramecium sonneborni]|uniref:Uncharacterized protein n=1 Tax=Paramecium sonneborni TaxID=65129 RepID=A0A8S1K6E7_9CILI|nr:unnamed protein product [Paramecium sonneborni]